MKLYETSWQIEFLYKDYNYSLGGEQSSYYHNVGLNGSTSPNFQQAVVIGGTTNFSTPSNNIRFTLTPPAQLSVSPKFIDFGLQTAGFPSAELFVNITNVAAPGSGNLNISSASIIGNPDFNPDQSI